MVPDFACLDWNISNPAYLLEEVSMVQHKFVVTPRKIAFLKRAWEQKLMLAKIFDNWKKFIKVVSLSQENNILVNSLNFC